MKILDLLQGSEEWNAKRLECFCASEAPAIMGASKYMSRNQLLDLKKGGFVAPVDSITQGLFDKGHAAEAKARGILELLECCDYPPVVGVREIKGMQLLASFDGIEEGEPGGLIFEHKLWNATLAENVRNGTLEPYYYWQLEHQCLVNGNDRVYFISSDGTEENRVTMVYKSDTARQVELVKGWKQFQKDLAWHEVKAKQEVVVGKQTEAFPIISYKVEGSLLISNIKTVLPMIKERAANEMSRTLETDQDFADKHNLNTATKKARAALKEIVASARGEFESFKTFSEYAEELDAIFQKMQSHGEKLVKTENERRKGDIVKGAQIAFNEHVRELNKKITPLALSHVGVDKMPDFAGATKNKRTLESLQASVDGVLASEKIALDQAMAKIVPNQIYLCSNAEDYRYLFGDVAQIINQDTEAFQAIVDKRVAEHVKSEEVKSEELRESIRKEEAQKLADAEAKKAADKELDDQAREDYEKQRIAAESGEAKEPEVYPEPEKELTTSHQDPATEDKEVPTFREDIEAWNKRNLIPKLAYTELIQLLIKHSAFN